MSQASLVLQVFHEIRPPKPNLHRIMGDFYEFTSLRTVGLLDCNGL